MLSSTGSNFFVFVAVIVCLRFCEAIPASWLVLVPFSKATGYWWGQMIFGTAVTFMEAIFALGALYLNANMTLGSCLLTPFS